MQFIQEKNRTQSILFPESLDQIIDQDNEVRIIDLFVESINLSDFKFVIKSSLEGRPAYNPKDLLKLFVYGYLNQIRSSRALEKEIQKHTTRKKNYQAMQKQLEESGEVQISASDPESRQLITRNNITEVAYNVQTVVDSKHCIPIDYKVTNENDSKAMGGMPTGLCELRRTRVILQTNEFTALYDKGYHTGSEFETANKLGIKVMVAIPQVASHAPDPKYDIANFIYDENKDIYCCPEQQALVTNGRWYKKNRRTNKNFCTFK